VFVKTKGILGGRVRFILTGAAPISPSIIDFLKVVFCAPILVAYG
jgi:long-chain acyl-CoA synthetase